MPLAENAVYFFHFVALCLVWPYLPLYLSRYVSEAELGLLLGATRLVGVAASPAWAWLADAKCGRGPIFALSWLCWQLLTPLVLVAANGMLGGGSGMDSCPALLFSMGQLLKVS